MFWSKDRRISDEIGGCHHTKMCILTSATFDFGKAKDRRISNEIGRCPPRCFGSKLQGLLLAHSCAYLISALVFYSGRASLALARSATAAARSAQSQTLLGWPGLPLLSSLLRRSLCSVGVYCCRQACPEPIFAELARLATAAAKLQQQLRPGARKALVCNVDTILKWKFRRSILQYRVMCARGALALQILKNLLYPRRVRHQCRALPNTPGVRPRSDQSGSTLVESDPKTPR